MKLKIPLPILRRFNRIFGLLLLVLSSSLAAVQAPLSHYYQDIWTTRNGLPHNSINSIAQTAEGYLWFATWEGVARYNGREFRVFERGEPTGLPDSGMRSLTVDGAGLLVAGARGGVSRYERQRWSPEPDLPAMVNHVLRDSAGRLWFATEGDGVYMRDGDGGEHHYSVAEGLPGAGVYRLAEGADGGIWIGTSLGLAEIREGRIRIVTDIPAVPVLALLHDSQGRLLVGSERGAYVGERDRYRRLSPALADEAISSLLVDEAGDIWLGTIASGLIRVSRFGIERLGMADGLPDNRVVSLFQDSERSIWVGTNGGLLRLRDAPFTSYTQDKGLSGDYVRTVLAHSDGSVWVGTSNGLNHIPDGEVIPLRIRLPDGGVPSVLSLAEGRDGTLWVGTYTHGLLQIRRGELVDIIDRARGLGANEIRAVLPATDGTLWVGTAKGLSQMKDGRIRTYVQADGLPGDFILSLYEANNGDIWVGTGVGVGIVRGARIEALYLNRQDNAEYAFGFYQEPDGRHMWLATDRGLLRYRQADGSLAAVGKRHGLPIEKMFQPVADRLGGLWLTTNRGMLRLSREQAHRVADGELAAIGFEHFGEGDGMASAQANGGSSPAAARAADGSVWIATAKGVARVQPERLAEFGQADLPVVVEAVEVNGRTVDVEGPLQLPAGSDRLLLRYAGLGYVMPERIQYRTMLEGFDRDWVARSRQNQAEYTNLPPGDYVFRVAAAYPYGDWSEQEGRLAFSIRPFFWQRPLFWWGGALLGLGSLWLLMRLRLRMLKRSAEQLKQQVTEKTRELQLQSRAFERQAREDQLTGLANRRAFDEELTVAWANRGAAPLCLAVLDIDHFKKVNDRWSHAVGDEAIRAVASVLRRELRQGDLAARWGGEEFTLLFPGTAIEDARRICERVRRAIEGQDCGAVAAGLRLTVSLGLAEAASLSDEDKLLSCADKALYRAKEHGRNRVELWP
ncbi:GGDEF domain-containing protein [Zobellella endophytica]|uniref:diguanylate cyclase n=1 Tax=Zobellella endophytica TaxID=2116700 RepID=A0A2P7R7A8_9GAMM|nr:ligand-binding sensor domain-containing diguanylate cyclase [Zobellella endophytica]PSJ46098.1 GGDEF domain-containing protein [Zobellella endophytica]